MLIVGSTAIKRWYPDFPREAIDLDYYGSTDIKMYTTNSHKNDRFWHDDLRSCFPSFLIGIGTVCYAIPNELYTIKVSHSYWELKNGSWNKHIFDLMWLKERGAFLLPELHDKLYKIWEQVHGKKKMNLAQESDDFFRDAVKREYDHDSLHDSVAYGDTPMYESVLKEGSSVDVDMAKIKALSHGDKIRLYREEVYATALERIVIPRGYRVSPGSAYQWALRRTITSLTKGWSAQFILDNIQDFSRPDTDYVGRHLSRKDRLKPYGYNTTMPLM